MNLRVLLVESEPEDVLFIRDVLIEIESGRYWSNWIHIETLYAATWTDASALLASEPVDVILLDPDLPDSQGVEALRRVQLIAERIPLILLIGPESDAMAIRMIREGAQDFLIKEQVDCAPLAHAIRNSIERHRVVRALRATATIDSLTGLPDLNAFLACAERDRKLAERLGRRLMILVVEPRNLTAALEEQRRDLALMHDLALMETADQLRSMAGPTDLVGRIDETRFGIAVFDTGAESIEKAWDRIRKSAALHHLSVGAAIFGADPQATLEILLEQAALDLSPGALAMRG